MPGLADLFPWQHSRLTFDFRFTRPAQAAKLIWSHRLAATDHPITLSADRCGGRLELLAATDGVYRVVLEAGPGVRTESELRTRLDALIKGRGNGEPAA